MATTLYAYVLGTDLDDVAPRIEAHLDELVAARTWRVPDVWVVNQRETPGEWDLGLNLTLPAKPHQKLDWLDDAAAIATALTELHTATGRSFVIGMQAGKSAAQDVLTIDSAKVDLDALKSALSKAVR
jgi:hypothetical protein